MLGLGDPADLQHRVEHAHAAGLGHLRVVAGRVRRRRRQHAREQGSLGERELRHGLVEVRLRGRADAVGALAEVAGRQVLVEDRVLVVLAVELAGEDRLADLAGDRPIAGGEGLLHVLLGDGGAALEHLLVRDVGPERSDRAAQVDATVLVEAPVLAGDDGVLDDLRDVLLLHGDRRLELLVGAQVRPVGVQHGGGLGVERRLRDREGGGQREEHERGEHDRRARDGGDHHDHEERGHTAQELPHHSGSSVAHGAGQLVAPRRALRCSARARRAARRWSHSRPTSAIHAAASSSASPVRA